MGEDNGNERNNYSEKRKRRGLLSKVTQYAATASDRGGLLHFKTPTRKKIYFDNDGVSTVSSLRRE